MIQAMRVSLCGEATKEGSYLVAARSHKSGSGKTNRRVTRPVA